MAQGNVTHKGAEVQSREIFEEHRKRYADRHGTNQCTSIRVTHHLGLFLFLLYGPEETLLFLFLGRLRGIQHNGVWAGPGEEKGESKTDRFII